MSRAENSKRAALFLCHRIPYPPDKGDKIRSWRILKWLTQRFDVHLAAFVDDPADMRHQSFLKEQCASVTLVKLNRTIAKIRSVQSLSNGEPLSFGFYRDATMSNVLAGIRQNNLALEFGFSSSIAPYMTENRGTPRILDLCDADSEKWRAYAAKARFPMRMIYEREARLLAVQETAIINEMDAAFAISAEEAELLGARRGVNRPVHWFGNGVDTTYFDPPLNDIADADNSAPDRANIAFIGAMDYWANVDAVLWFTDKIWPIVRRRIPSATFTIIGAHPAPDVLALSTQEGITVTGRVSDIRPYLFDASVVVAPMRIARGVQNKVLEAMAAGRPVVTTSAGAEGIVADHGRHFLIADDEQHFASSVGALLQDLEKARSLGVTARRLMRDRYSWDQQLNNLAETFADLNLV